MFATHTTPNKNVISIGGNSNRLTVAINDPNIHEEIDIDVDEAIDILIKHLHMRGDQNETSKKPSS